MKLVSVVFSSITALVVLSFPAHADWRDDGEKWAQGEDVFRWGEFSGADLFWFGLERDAPDPKGFMKTLCAKFIEAGKPKGQTLTLEMRDLEKARMGKPIVYFRQQCRG